MAIVAAGNEILLALITLVGIAIGVVGTYWGLKRTKSGKIETTEAADLWKEAGTMRTELRNEVATLNEEIKTLKDANRKLEEGRIEDRARIGELERQIELMQRDEQVLRDRIVQLERTHG